jgi:hypothetical protein
MADQGLKRVAGSGGSLLGAAGVAQAMAAEEALRHQGAAEDLVVAEVAEPSEIGFWKLAAIRFLHHRTATISMGILLFIIVTAMIVPTFQGDLYRLQDYTHPYGAPFEFHSRAVSVLGASSASLGPTTCSAPTPSVETRWRGWSEARVCR